VPRKYKEFCFQLRSSLGWYYWRQEIRTYESRSCPVRWLIYQL